MGAFLSATGFPGGQKVADPATGTSYGDLAEVAAIGSSGG